MYYHFYQSPVGKIALTANDNGLTSLTFIEGKKSFIIPDDHNLNKDKFEQVCLQLEEYFSGERTKFDLPLIFNGTPFQVKVWQALCSIPLSETKTYAWLANKIDNPKAVRAVGAANGANPIGLIVPCHRVIGKDGKLTGYAGGLALKAKLLMHEKAQFKVS
jgi:methylated-DNA-[protein]-cysteine S-methyltransferase